MYIFEIIKKVWTILNAKTRLNFCVLLLCSAIAGAFDAVGIAFIGPYIGFMLSPSDFHFPLASGISRQQATLGLIFLLLVGGVTRTLAVILHQKFIFNFEKIFTIALLRYYLNRPYKFFLETDTRELGKNVLQEVIELVNKSVIPVTHLITSSLNILLIIAIILVIAPQAALVFGPILIITYGVIFFLSRKKLSAAGDKRRSANSDRFSGVNELFRGIKTVKINATEERHLAVFSDVAEHFRVAQTSAQIIANIPRPIIEGSLSLLLVIVIYVSVEINGAQLGAKAAAAAASLGFAAYRLIPQAQLAFHSISQIQFSRALVELFTVARPEPKTIKLGQQKERLQTDGLGGEQQKVQELAGEKLNFRYDESSKNVIADLFFAFPRGARVGIFGPSGSGKTTLIDLITGLLPVSSGALSFDPALINFSYAPQEAFIFDGTLAENIMLKSDFSEEDLDRAAVILRGFRLDEELGRRDENLLATAFADGGKSLSGGQKQRIGLARALFKRSDVLVLDEATSALDMDLEIKVLEFVKEFYKGTILVVSHSVNARDFCNHHLELGLSR